MNPPDPIPAPVSMRAKDARAVLLTIAALHGGNCAHTHAAGERCGLAVMPVGAPPISWVDWMTWTWGRLDRKLAWRAPSELGRIVLPLGRIDRGLGAAKMKAGPRATAAKPTRRNRPIALPRRGQPTRAGKIPQAAALSQLTAAIIGITVHSVGMAPAGLTKELP